jgi:uncharacterized protein
MKYLFFSTPVVSFANSEDCSCSEPTAMTFDNYPNMDLSTLFIVSKTNYITQLTSDFYLGFSPYAPFGPSVFDLEVFNRYQTFILTPQPLSSELDELLAQQNLIVPFGRSLFIPESSPTQLSVWLHVTNACNLDCAYCYIQKSSEYMSEETGSKTIDTLFATAQLNQSKNIRLKYAGGEALLHFKLIKVLHEYSEILSKKTGISLSAVILSNGFNITKQMAEWCRQYNIKLVISIDGIGYIHDQQRSDKRGKATFQKIQDTIDNVLIPMGIKPEISITVTGLNAAHISDVVRWALDRNLIFHLNLYRQPTIFPVSNLEQNLNLEQQAVIAGIKAAYKVIEDNLPSYPLLNNILDKMHSTAHLQTCGVGKNYIVVDHHGKFSQCQMQINKPIDSVTPITLMPQLAKSHIHNLNIQEKIDCQNCNFRYRCTGGCALETYRVTGSWNSKSPHCEIYKALYPEALRLEGLRLLKNNGLLPTTHTVRI